MKRYALIASWKAELSDSESACLMKDARLFAVKVRKELEAADADSTPEAKYKKPAKGPITIRASEFVRNVRKIIDKYTTKKINTFAMELKTSRHSVGRIMHDDLRYKSYVTRRDQLSFEKTKDYSPIHA